jgi:hypothetical protein
MRRIIVVTLVVLALAPPPDITNCSRPDYRQAHLAYCNQTQTPIPYGGGRRGLLGGILGLGGLGL